MRGGFMAKHIQKTKDIPKSLLDTLRQYIKEHALDVDLSHIKCGTLTQTKFKLIVDGDEVIVFYGNYDKIEWFLRHTKR